MRGRRIGEASNPGPPKRITAAQEEFLFGSGPEPSGTPDLRPSPIDLELDDLFDPSSIIDELGLDPVGSVPAGVVHRGPRNKWQDALISMDDVNLEGILSKRPALLKSVPPFLKGQVREAYVVALEAA